LVSDILARDGKYYNLFYSVGEEEYCGRNEKWGGLATVEKRVYRRMRRWMEN
jgi:hypothetical protein